MNEIKFKQKIDALKFNDNGLIPCVAQDHESKQVLMLAWGSRDTLFQSVSIQINNNSFVIKTLLHKKCRLFMLPMWCSKRYTYIS